MRHVVITGANRGIGLALARHYQEENWSVTGICRESSSELKRLPHRSLRESMSLKQTV